MKRLIALTLLIAIVALTLTSCSGVVYSRGYDSAVVKEELFIKAQANKRFFKKDAVELDLFYSLYCLDDKTLEEVKVEHNYPPFDTDPQTEIAYAIYISNNNSLTFERYDNGDIIDHENKVNAILYKYITLEEAFETNYGYTSTRGDLSLFFQIYYNHSEELTIPVELFDSSNNAVYIHIVSFSRNFALGYRKCSVGIDFVSLGNYVYLK